MKNSSLIEFTVQLFAKLCFVSNVLLVAIDRYTQVTVLHPLKYIRRCVHCSESVIIEYI